MNGDVTNMGNNPELVGHEFLHQMGQDDEGKGDKFDKNGRIKYTATAENGYKMNPISKDDINNILTFAQENGKPQSEIIERVLIFVTSIEKHLINWCINKKSLVCKLSCKFYFNQSDSFTFQSIV